MKIYTFDETTYPGVPDEVGPETRLTNKYLDPQLAAQTYAEHLEEWVFGEELGFDGAFVNEHHFTYFNINPSSTVLASAIAARTKRMKIGVIGHVLPIRHPVQTAEEFSQLDVLSGGLARLGPTSEWGEEVYLPLCLPNHSDRYTPGTPSYTSCPRTQTLHRGIRPRCPVRSHSPV